MGRLKDAGVAHLADRVPMRLGVVKSCLYEFSKRKEFATFCVFAGVFEPLRIWSLIAKMFKHVL